MFEVLAEPHRRRILDLLREQDQAVGDLVSALGLSQPGVSKHLRVLREAGLVEVRADAQRRVYRLRTEPLREIDEWLAPYRAAWYPQEIVGERRAGAPLRFVSSAGDGFDGQMLVFDPPAVMEFTWGADRLRIELRADGAGTLLTLTDTFDELGKAARDGAGWHECLDRLVSELDGTPQRPMGALWVEVHPRYVTQLGPDAGMIGAAAMALIKLDRET